MRLLLVLLLIGIVGCGSETEPVTEKRESPRPSPAVKAPKAALAVKAPKASPDLAPVRFRVFPALGGLTVSILRMLTADQKKQVAAINKEFSPKMAEYQKKLNSLIKPDQMKAYTAVRDRLLQERSKARLSRGVVAKYEWMTNTDPELVYNLFYDRFFEERLHRHCTRADADFAEDFNDRPGGNIWPVNAKLVSIVREKGPDGPLSNQELGEELEQMRKWIFDEARIRSAERKADRAAHEAALNLTEEQKTKQKDLLKERSITVMRAARIKFGKILTDKQKGQLAKPKRKIRKR